MSEIRKTMQNKFGEIIGQASMCWIETRTGVFDSTRAIALVQKCLDVVHQEIGIGVTRYSEVMASHKKALEEIEKLKKANAILYKAVEFYGSADQWSHLNGSSIYSVIDSDDLGDGEFYFNDITDDLSVGGKRAREALEQMKAEGL